MSDVKSTDFEWIEDAWMIKTPLRAWSGFALPRNGSASEATRSGAPAGITVSIDSQDQSPIGDAEVRLAQWAIDHEHDVQRALLATLLPWTAALPKNEQETPLATTVDGFAPLIELVCVVVYRFPSKDGAPYLGLALRCAWGDERGLGVLMQGTRVLEIGAGELAFARRHVELDARRTGALPLFDLAAPSTDKELAAMEEVGRLRNQMMGRVFLVSWVLTTTFLTMARVGLMWAGMGGAGVGAAIAKFFVSMRTDEIIAAAAAKHGVDPKSLARDKYIIED